MTAEKVDNTMIIKIRCKNCKYEFSICEEELRNNNELYNYCFLCGGKFEVINLEEIVIKDIETEIRNNITLWFNKLGIEYTLEMIERHRTLAIYKFYKVEIEKRGLKL
jgi:hypothetical protein